MNGKSDKNIMGLGWAANKKLESEGLATAGMVVHLGQTSKLVGMLIIPAVAANNQPVTQTKVGSKQLKEGVRNRSAKVSS